MSDIINLGIIGHGFMGHEHEAMLSDFEGIRVTAVCDTAADQLEDVKGESSGTARRKNCWPTLISR